jgi:hypothetical protein
MKLKSERQKMIQNKITITIINLKVDYKSSRERKSVKRGIMQTRLENHKKPANASQTATA